MWLISSIQNLARKIHFMEFGKCFVLILLFKSPESDTNLAVPIFLGKIKVPKYVLKLKVSLPLHIYIYMIYHM